MYIYYEWRRKHNFLGEMSSFFSKNYLLNPPQSLIVQCDTIYAISYEFKLLVLVILIKGGPMFKISETQNPNIFFILIFVCSIRMSSGI